MEPYIKDKHKGRKKFKRNKINPKNGTYWKTETSTQEARNANRSRKKGARQEAKKEIRTKFYGIHFPTPKMEKEFWKSFDD